MKIILYISDMLIPLTILGILAYGFLQKVNVYDTFVEGAKDGISIAFKIWPTIVGLMVAIGMLRASGTLDVLSIVVKPFTEAVHIPSPLVPLILMRPISAAGSTGIVLDLFQKFGPDSYIGRVASVMMGCTETVFYTISLYFMSVKIKNTRYAVKGALWATFAGIAASIIICLWIFNQ